MKAEAADGRVLTAFRQRRDRGSRNARRRPAFGTAVGLFAEGLKAVPAALRCSRRTYPSGEQRPARDHQVGQREHAVKPGVVLCQPLVADLPVAEQVLDDVERMLDPRTHLCLRVLHCDGQVLQQPVGHRLDLAFARCYQPRHVRPDATCVLRGNDLVTPRNPSVASICMNPALLAMQKLMRVAHVALVGRRRMHAVHQARVGVRADVRLHPEMPLRVAFEMKNITPLQLHVNRKYELADDVFGFDLIDPSNQPLPSFQPGAHLRLAITEHIVRQYSIFSSSSDCSKYSIAVRLQTHSRGGSLHLHKHIQAGAKLHSSLPLNSFPLTPGSDPIYFIAAGIGITPILSMIQDCARNLRAFHLDYIGRTQHNTPFINFLQTHYPSSSINILLNQERANIQSHLASALGRLDMKTHVYFCGPPTLMQFINTQMSRLPPDRRHYESFAPNIDPAISHSSRAQSSNGFTIYLVRSNSRLRINSGERIIDVLRANGFMVDTSCEQGYCGTCLTRYLEGDVQHNDTVLDEEDRAKFLMICCSRAAQEGGEILLDM